MSLVHQIDYNPQTSKLPMTTFVTLLIIAVGVGVLAGFIGSKVKGSSSTSYTSDTTVEKDKNGLSKTAGIADEKTYKDKVEGDLKEGGIEGEGAFHLVRPGGDSQNVYLTSSTVDLAPYVGKKIRVHGVTINGQKAGWLMDVGFVELLQ